MTAAVAAAAICAMVGIATAQAPAGSIGAMEAAGAAPSVAITSDPVITAILSSPADSAPGRSYTKYTFLAEDATGSMEVYGFSSAGSYAGGYVPTVGDQISISGQYSPYNAIPELESTFTAFSQVSSGNTVPAPVPITIPTAYTGGTTLPSNVQGYYVQLNDVTVGATSLTSTQGGYGALATYGTANQTLTLSDASGNTSSTLTMYYWPSSYGGCLAGFNGQTVLTGSPVNITGIMDVYSAGNPELIPMSITPYAPVPEPGTFALLGVAGIMGLGAVASRRLWRRRAT